ncbi:MAG TPA: YdeI/OmpD-associated family protein, partial [Chthoniobacterales bacterium]|nr:YdeI/OmpD-associated family protein [Chthoniobacterales bacterium]
FGCIRSIDDLPDEKTLTGYVRKAAELNNSGTSVPVRDKPRKRPPIKVPADLAGALATNKKAKQTFENLSPSGKREYVEWIVGAKRAETREKRLKTAMDWLGQGKPHNWRYLK